MAGLILACGSRRSIKPGRKPLDLSEINPAKRVAALSPVSRASHPSTESLGLRPRLMLTPASQAENLLLRKATISKSSKWFHLVARNHQRCCDEYHVFYYKFSIAG